MNIPSNNYQVSESERYVTPTDFVKKFSGWSYKKILKLVKTKGFPSFKPIDSSNRYLIDIAGIPEWLETQKKKPKPYK